ERLAFSGASVEGLFSGNGIFPVASRAEAPPGSASERRDAAASKMQPWRSLRSGLRNERVLVRSMDRRLTAECLKARCQRQRQREVPPKERMKGNLSPNAQPAALDGPARLNLGAELELHPAVELPEGVPIERRAIYALIGLGAALGDQDEPALIAAFPQISCHGLE